MSTLTAVGAYTGPAPVVHPESEPFWRGLGEGHLRLQRCSDCATVRWPIAPVCHHCGGLGHEWTDVPVDGTVSAAIVIERATGDPVWAQAVPFITAMVDMADGRRLPGRVLCDCGRGTRHGEPVTGGYFSTDDGHGVLCFVHGCWR
jgi:uncharacterized OB-fold protein